MTVRALAPMLAISIASCGGTQKRGTCDEVAAGLRAQCRAERWEGGVIACVTQRDEEDAQACVGGPRPVIPVAEECLIVRKALVHAPSRFEDQVGARLTDDEAAGLSYLESKLDFPGMECAITDHYATEMTALQCERTYDAWEPAYDEYVRLRAVIDPPCLDDSWRSSESTIQDFEYTEWSEGVELLAPHVLVMRSPPDDAGRTTVKLLVVNKMEAR